MENAEAAQETLCRWDVEKQILFTQTIILAAIRSQMDKLTNLFGVVHNILVRE